MSQINISTEALDDFRATLQSPGAGSSRTHLPTILPLAFPTPLHTLNALVSIHLIHAILSHPSHALYFAETNADPKDVATMGVMGLYLSSSEDWSSENLLSTAAWKAGKMNQSLISEMFRIETTREAEHETLKGIRVGGRWDPGARLVEELVKWFKGSAGLMGKMQCVGEWVGMVVQDSWQEGDDAKLFVENCCRWATSTCPPLADFNSSSDGSVLPFAPLRLLYDLATRQEATHDLDLRLPKIQELEDITPLPLPLSPLLFAGVLKPTPDSQLAQSLAKATTSSDRTRIDVDEATYKSLLEQSVLVSRLLREAAIEENYLDIRLAVEALDKREVQEGKGYTIVPTGI